MIREGGIGGRRTGVFTLQWHLTNACEGQCAHCYDRSRRDALPLEGCLDILRRFHAFCRQRRVRGQITLTGGNPLRYPGFWELYAAIRHAGLRVSLLGNPLDEETLARLMRVGAPVYYQVSLEGLRATNDAIRGEGHYDRTLDFLRAARRVGLTTHVMLTVHRANLAEVIPLGLALANLTGTFTFNRLAAVGEAQGMPIPRCDAYHDFLRAYLDAATEHPQLGVKENLFNPLRHAQRLPSLRGCTGQGCGAAFNFVAVLPDGEVHACRKFPSLLGRIDAMEFATLLDTPAARAYRRGPRACVGCPVRRACRGCMAVIAGAGGDPLVDADPHCPRHCHSTIPPVGE